MQLLCEFHGGTWEDHRYPGAKGHIKSVNYRDRTLERRGILQVGHVKENIGCLADS